MPSVRIPLNFDLTSRESLRAPVGGSQWGTLIEKDSRIVNGVVEGEDVVKRPGMYSLTFSPAIAAGQGQGIFSWDGNLVVGTANTVYLIKGGVSTSLGSINGTQFPLSFIETAGDSWLVMHNGSNIYITPKQVVIPGTSAYVAGITSGSAVVTYPGAGSTTNIVVGQAVTGTGIPTGTTVLSIIADTSFTLSANATATNAHAVLTLSTLLYSPLGGTGVLGATINTKGGFYGTIAVVTISGKTVTLASHGFIADQRIIFSGDVNASPPGSLPLGMTSGTAYYVSATNLTGSTFEFSATKGGASITTSGAQTAPLQVCYDSVPSVTFSGGSPATGTVNIVNHQVESIAITAPGTYGSGVIPDITIGVPPTYSPAVSSSPDSNITFTAVSNGVFYKLSSYSVVGLAKGYTTAPAITFALPTEPGTSITGTHLTGGYAATGHTVIDSSGQITSVVIDNPGNYYYSDIAAKLPPTISAPPNTRALATSNMNDTISGPFAPGMAYLNGVCYVLKKDTGQIYGSGSNNPRTWNALNNISLGQEGIGFARHLNYLTAFSPFYTQFYYDAGLPAPGSPLAEHQAARFEIGCANGYSIAQLEQSLVWVGNAASGGRSVFMLNGLLPVKVSTRYIDKYLNACDMSTNLSNNVRSYCFKISGHTLYLLTMKDLSLTLVYDLDEKKWYQWSTTLTATSESYFTPTAFTGHIEYEPGLYLQDESSGKVYRMDTGYFSDDGTAIHFRAVTPIVDSGTNKRKFYTKAEIIGDKVSGTASIAHYDDDYLTRSTYRSVTLSDDRPIIYQCGASRRRAWEVYNTDDTPLRLKALELEFDVGEQGGGQEG